MTDINYKSLRKTRKKRFVVKVINARDSYRYLEGEECELSVTHNGFQWISINLTKTEATKVAKALMKWKSKNE